MTDTIKVLGQAIPGSSNVPATLYTNATPSGAVVSSFTACNLAAANTLIRVAVSVSGAALTNAQYIYYEQSVYANETFTGTIGVTLGSPDVFKGVSSNGSVAFNVFGTELS